MAIGFGHQSFVGIGLETVYGTPVASTKYLEVLKDTLKLETGRATKPALRGFDTQRSVPKKKGVSGGLELAVTATGLELLLSHCFGTEQKTGAGDPYTRVWTGGALPVALTVNCNRDTAGVAATSTFAYHGCQVEKLTLKQGIEEFLIASIDFIGEDETLIAAETPTFTTFDGFDWSMLALTVGATPVASAVKDFEITFSNNLAKDRYKLGQLYRKGLGRGGMREISGKMTLEFESLTELNRYRNQTAGEAISAVWTYGANRTLTIAVPKPEWDGGEPEVTSSGALELTMEFHALRSATDGDAATVTLVNGTA